MAITTGYDPSSIESKWYEYWEKQGFFKAVADPEKEPYTIVIPPPNVTGVLHMGHMLNNTIQDILIRKARMEGKSACWVPGTDHASIATEARVVKMLREKGIKKSDLSRDEFLEHAWEWKEKYGGIILQQLRHLGASCDWDRTAFTMDDQYYKAVIRVFVDLYRKGYIYRGLRMVNWDVEAKTAVSNEEVMYREEGEPSFLYHVRYAIKDSEESLVIATQRPETIMGDSGVAVNPNDERYKHLIGKKAIIPFVNREVPIIGDDYVTLDFGTGCLKVTPAHDINDYEIGQRHNLEVIDTIDLDGKMSEACGVPEYIGMDRFEARRQVVKDLKNMGILVKEEPFTTRIGRSERTDSVIEPKLSLQWFINMKSISKKAHQVVMDDEVKLVPDKFKNTYNHWMENVRDWCISRQLWWGQRIPAYFYGEGDDDFVVAETPEEALALAREKSGSGQLQAGDLRQDDDVLDTWASSWLFPIQVFGGFNDASWDAEAGKIDLSKNKELDYFYPTSTLVTAPEILFFWVARMIIAGYEYTGKKPFENVYLTGIVRDSQRRKMSKSLGNSPDPLELIAKYGADGVRTGMLFSSPAGNDLLFDEKLCEQGRNFSNKIWNAFRLITGWQVADEAAPKINHLANAWMESRFNKALTELKDHFGKFRMSDALMTVYKLVWDDFCSWYLELIKPEYGKPMDRESYGFVIGMAERVLRILHPFMPFISEELWQDLKPRTAEESLIISRWPEVGSYDEGLLKKAETTFQVISGIRNLRSGQGLSPKENKTIYCKSANENSWMDYTSWVEKLTNVTLEKDGHPEHYVNTVVDKDEFFMEVDPQAAAGSLEELEKELDYVTGFLKSVEKKLSNEKFVNNAPEKVVAMERKKQADAQARMEVLKESINRLKS